MLPVTNDLDLCRDHLRVAIQGATIDVHVGMHPWEKHPERPTRLNINVDLFVPLKSGRTSTQGKIIDYDHVRSFILGLRARPHVDLLETIVDDILAVCFQDERVAACKVSILKPDIFNEAQGAGIEAFRTRSSWES